MKRKYMYILLVFSVALNLAVAGTIAWHYITSHNAEASQMVPTMTTQDLQEFRMKLLKNLDNNLPSLRDQILAKRMEIIQTISQKPGDTSVLQDKIQELNSLRSQMEKIAIMEVSKTTAQIDPAKRDTFLEMLKNRTCMGPGMAKGRGCGPGASCCPMK